MLRSRSNCSVSCVVPRVDVEVIWARPGMLANCCSSGLATEDAMVSALAPGRLACTAMVGKSTCGSEAIGMSR